MVTTAPMISAGMIQMIRRADVSRLASSSNVIALRTGAGPASLANAGYSSNNRSTYPITRQ